MNVLSIFFCTLGMKFDFITTIQWWEGVFTRILACFSFRFAQLRFHDILGFYQIGINSWLNVSYRCCQIFTYWVNERSPRDCYGHKQVTLYKIYNYLNPMAYLYVFLHLTVVEPMDFYLIGYTLHICFSSWKAFLSGQTHRRYLIYN